jgi:aldehyde dehydrogenase (NAD+)
LPASREEAVRHEHDDIFVGGAWMTAAGSERIEVINPSTEAVIGAVPDGTTDDVAAAVSAARSAAPQWAATPPEQRAAALRRLHAALSARREEAITLIATEVGCPRPIATAVQVDLPLRVIESFADLLGDYPFSEQIGNSTVLAEPVGVVGAITPWNYPLHQPVAKVAAALAAGCPVVLKPAEDTPLIAYLLAEAVAVAGFPDGVFNLVPGRGATGQALAAHSDVDMVSFTGSTAVGRQVGATVAGGVRRLALELGGKSANVILPGADLPRAVAVGVANAFLNSGQTCSAWTRMLVHTDSYDEAITLAVPSANRQKLGDPLAEGTKLGPLVSAKQRDRVRSYIAAGIDEGAKLVAGGADPPAGLDRGFFVRPTVFAEVTPDMRIAREEIFGPVLCVMRYHDEDEALRIANDSEYGLAGAVWAADNETAAAFARRMQTGQVDINGGRFNHLAPFGGYKRSGIGREFGRHGLAEFLQYKSIQW